jgi:hypothetical protein
MPLVKKLTGKLWEVRTQLPTRIARVLFTVKRDHMVMLHGFINLFSSVSLTQSAVNVDFMRVSA